MDHRPPRPDQPYAWDDERLSAYLDGELSAPEQAQLEARLVVDPELRQLVDELRAVRQQLEVLPEYRLKPTFADQVLRRAEQEMLLAPLGRESVETAGATSTQIVSATPPTIPAAVIALPSRSTSHRWRRGAMWTAIAAAAVLLLIVTNRPNAPQQEHVARNDVPDAAIAKSSAKVQAIPAAGPAGVDKAKPDLNAVAAKGGEPESLAKSGAREAQQFPFGQAEPSVTTVVGEAGNKTGVPKTPASSFGATAAAPNQDPAASMKPDSNQLARSTEGGNPNANQRSDNDRQAEIAKGPNSGSPVKSLMKSQAPGQRKGTQEKQSAAQHEQLSPELKALLASDEFSRLTSAGEGDADSAGEDQVLVIYMTPRDAAKGENSFESLLASNSIPLAEKSLDTASEPQRQRSVAPANSAERDAEPLAKSAMKDEKSAGAKDRNATEVTNPGETENPSNGPMLRKESAPSPASDSIRGARQALPVNELYYLEAEESQVDDLLRQIRSSSAQYSRLNIRPQALKLAELGSKNQDEKGFAKKPAATLPGTASAFYDDSRAGGVPSGKQKYGNQQPGEMKQMAQGAAPAAPPTLTTPPAPPTPAAPAAAALPAAPAPPAPASEPIAPPVVASPQEIAATPASANPFPAAIPNDAPAAADGATSLGDGKGGFGQPNNGVGNRGAMQADKSLKTGASEDRAVAYRLRGVESLLPAKKLEPLVQASEGGGGAGGAGVGGGHGAGAAMAGKAESGKLKANDSAKRGNAPKAAEQPAKPNDARSQIQAAGVAEQFDGKTADAKNANASPASQPTADAATKPSPDLLGTEKKREQPQLQADLQSVPEGKPAPDESQQRRLERNKETEKAEELSLTESSTLAGAAVSSAIRRSDSAKEAAKKAAPAPVAKRVRVLFVIEHEAQNE